MGILGRISGSHVHVSTLKRDTRKEIKFDMAFLKMATIWGLNSHSARHKVGCLIVRDYSIISDGYNGTPSGFDNKCEKSDGETKWEVLHSEANAITKLARSSQSSAGATLYTTFSPCKECAKLMLQSGIVRLVYTKQHSDIDGLKMLAQAGIRISQYFINEITDDEKNWK